eukprot:8221425-Heterocapsa_arctica.AAC.1
MNNATHARAAVKCLADRTGTLKVKGRQGSIWAERRNRSILSAAVRCTCVGSFWHATQTWA